MFKNNLKYTSQLNLEEELFSFDKITRDYFFFVIVVSCIQTFIHAF